MCQGGARGKTQEGEDCCLQAKERSSKKANLPTWTSSLLSCEKIYIYFCCLSQPVCYILLRQPEQNNVGTTEYAKPATPSFLSLRAFRPPSWQES